MRIVGLSAFYHESACCLMVDGRPVAAAAEERFSRRKHDARLPVEAFRFCLEEGGRRAGGSPLAPGDLDAVAYYESPRAKLARQLALGVPEAAAGSPRGPAWLDPRRAERAIRERLGWDGPTLVYPHHLSHAASAYLLSDLPEAAVLTVDGVGEWATTGYGRGEGDSLELFADVSFPHSLGLLYSTITDYLGFAVNGGEYKVMGLAPYGEPRFLRRLERLVEVSPDGGYALDLAYFDFVTGRRMASPALAELLGFPPRRRGGAIEPRHRDLAASVQRLLEEILLDKARWLHAETGSKNLCLAGGVALNCVANGRLLREGPYERLRVPPAPGDSGACLGAAALAHRELAGERPARLEHGFLGPAPGRREVGALLAATGVTASGIGDGGEPEAAGAGAPGGGGEARGGGRATGGAGGAGGEAALLAAVVERLAAGKVVAWVDGAMETGPRALGARSLLADPRDPDVRDRLNRKIKRREPFRPFAPVVTRERAREHFDLSPAALEPARFMMLTCRVDSPLPLPAVTHVDGSARPQVVDRRDRPRLAALLDAFEAATGCPVLLNTSFNLAGEPIVASPYDALSTMARSGVDALVLGDVLIDREGLPEGVRSGLRRGVDGGRPEGEGGGGAPMAGGVEEKPGERRVEWEELLRLEEGRDAAGESADGEGLGEHLYTFV